MPHVYDSEEERQQDEALFLALGEDRARRLEESQAEEANEAGLSKERRAIENSLAEYFRWMWGIMYPGKPLEWSWHYDLLAEYMQLFYERKIRYFVANVPPRTGKTEFLSVAFPTWTWIKDPLPSFAAASMDKGLASILNDKRRRVIQHPEYQRLFGHRVHLRFGANKAEMFENTRGGGMLATSPDSQITGRGGDFLLMDDILSPDGAESETQRDAVFEWIDGTFLQRRNNMASSPLALIEQRVGERDATHHLLKTLPADEVIHVSIPLLAEKDEAYVFPISKRVHKRPEGDILQPGRHPRADIEKMRKGSRLRIFSTQYQQKPIGKTGKIFPKDWWRYYGPKSEGFERQLPTTFDEVCISVDATFKDGKKNDEVSILVCGRVKADRYVIDRHTDRMTFTQTCAAVVAMRSKYPYARRVYIEDKANGPAIIDTMRSKVNGLIPVEPKGSKEARAEAAAANVESHNWYLPGKASWVNDWVELFEAFPNVPHDDDVDAFSQADLKMNKGGLKAMSEWLESQLNGEPNPQPPSVFDQAETALRGG